MKIEKDRIYINGFLEPLQSELDKRYTLYPYKMIQINTKSESYHVGINGLEDGSVDNNKLDMLAQVDLFNNRISSGNITDLFSMLYHDLDKNITTYTHYLRIKTLHFCPDRLGLLDFKKSYQPLALQSISKKLYINIYEKNHRLINALSH